MQLESQNTKIELFHLHTRISSSSLSSGLESSAYSSIDDAENNSPSLLRSPIFGVDAAFPPLFLFICQQNTSHVKESRTLIR